MKKFRVISLFLVSMSIVLSACNGSSQVSPGALPDVTVAPGNQNPAVSPTLSAPQSTSPAVRYSIMLTNNYPWEAFVFLDQVFLFSIPPQRAATYGSIADGQHTLQVCRQQGMRECELSIDLQVTGPMNLSLGTDSPQMVTDPTSTVIPALPTTLPAESQTPMPASPVPTLNPPPITIIPNFALTAVPGQDRFLVTIHNGYPYTVFASMDGKHLLTIPPKQYMWHVGILSGWHTFTFTLIGGIRISEREIYIGKDTELWVSP